MEAVNVNNEETFQELFEKSLEDLQIESNSIIKGRVVEIQDKGVMVNIGFKSEGFISVEEFKDSKGEITVKPNDEIELYVLSKEDGFGRIRLSRKKALQLMSWGVIKECFNEGKPINGFVTKKVNGGFEVDLNGARAFLPFSLANTAPIKNPDLFINRYYDFKIISLEEKNFNIILDRKSLLIENIEKKRAELYEKIAVNTIIEGEIEFVKDEGAVVTLGADIRGFLPASNIGWGRIKSAGSYLRKGDTLKLKITEIEREKNKIILSIKHMTPDPWENIANKYQKGSKIKGKVTSIQDFGVFVELEPGVEGLIHVSELSWSRKKINPNTIFEQGEIAEVMIKDIDVQNRRISLSLKAIMPTQWEILQTKYKEGDKVKGTLKTITPFGLFIDIGEDENLFIHKNDILWSKKSIDLKSNYKIGQEIEAVILEIGKDNKKFSGSIKHLSADPYKAFYNSHKVGDVVDCEVSGIENFGLFVRLSDEIEGLVHISQLSPERVKDPASIFKIGDKVKALIKSIDFENRKISLSIREFIEGEEKKELKNYQSNNSSAVKLGEILNQDNK